MHIVIPWKLNMDNCIICYPVFLILQYSQFQSDKDETITYNIKDVIHQRYGCFLLCASSKERKELIIVIIQANKSKYIISTKKS